MIVLAKPLVAEFIDFRAFTAMEQSCSARSKAVQEKCGHLGVYLEGCTLKEAKHVPTVGRAARTMAAHTLR
jgi:hypothetical protein